jgi:oligo-1,6-glucosidase
MTNTSFTSIEDFRDVESLNHYAHEVAAGTAPDAVLAGLRAMSRDNARTPMQWDGTEHAGFTTGTPWIPVNANHTEVNAAAALADPHSVFHHYRRLIELRHTEPAVAFGDFRMLLADDDRIYAFTRRYEGTELLVVANFSAEDAEAPVPDAAAWATSELVLGNYPDAGGGLPGDPDAEGLALRPWEARVYRRPA